MKFRGGAAARLDGGKLDVKEPEWLHARDVSTRELGPAQKRFQG